ncbi:hypothetical protein Tco_1233840 [Tanacetum coccineum]
MPPKKTTTPKSNAAIKALVARSMADALAKYEANRGRNGDDSYDSGRGGRRQVSTTRECTYSSKGVLGLTQWFERMESIFHISNFGHDAAYGMPWKTLMKMMTDKYCPRSEIKKLEIEIWNLKVKGTDVVSYTQPFQELALMFGRMFPEESDQYFNKIQGSMLASKPKIMQEAIEIANDLMDQKVCAYAERQTENKRKFDNNNQAQQQPPKKQSVAIAYTVGSGERKEYDGTLPLCNRNPATAKNQRTITCFECGNQGHYKSDCSELNNRNQGNQAEGTEACGMVYALGGGEINQDIDDMEDDINA